MERSQIEEIVSRVVAAIRGEGASRGAGSGARDASDASSGGESLPVLKPLRPGEPVLVTEAALKKLAPTGGTVLVAGRAIITPSARDYMRKKGVEIKQVDLGSSAGGVHPALSKTIAIGADHRGFALKEHLKRELSKRGYSVVDVGTHKPERCDYPDFAAAVAKKVSSGQAAFGIVIDSAGIGSAIAANKVSGVRAACCWDVPSAVQARLHNNANVIALGADNIAPAKALEMATKFIETEYVPNERYERRLAKISELERKG